MNDLPSYLSNTSDPVNVNGKDVHCLMHADDIILLSKSAKGLQEKLDIHVLNTYCKDWCLTVNTSKTKILIFNKAGRLIKPSFRYGNENIECVSNCKYLGIWFSSSGSYSYAQNELYKKSLKAFFKLKKDLLSLNPNIRTSMHVFDHSIKPILLYDSDIWGMFNPFTMKCKKENPSFDNIYSGSLCEKIHLKFCKFILGVHKRTTNIAVLSELGRFPLYFNIIKCMLLYWYRLENLGKEYPLSKEAYNETKLLYLSTKPTWYESINIIVNILKTTNTDINLLLRKKHLENSKIMLTFFLNHYLSQNGKKQINQFSDSKLKIYNICKNNFGLEKYLTIPYLGLHNAQYFAQILYLVGGVRIINRNNVFHSFPDREITCPPCFFVYYCQHAKLNIS